MLVDVLDSLKDSAFLVLYCGSRESRRAVWCSAGEIPQELTRRTWVHSVNICTVDGSVHILMNEEDFNTFEALIKSGGAHALP